MKDTFTHTLKYASSTALCGARVLFLANAMPLHATEPDAHDLVYHAGHLFVTAQNSHSLVILKVSDELARFI